MLFKTVFYIINVSDAEVPLCRDIIRWPISCSHQVEEVLKEGAEGKGSGRMN